MVSQRRNLPLLATPETCSGRTYIVTGANSGIGLEAARHLASLGAGKVILGVRNLVAGEAAKRDIDESAGTAGTDVIQVWQVDLCSYDSVRAFVKRAADELDRIDAVIENAGLTLSVREMAEGHVKPLTVNVLSTFLMAVLLLPVMREKAKKVEGVVPRIVVVGSTYGFEATCKADWEGIKEDPIKGMDDEGMAPLKTYALTKLMEAFAIRHLARELVPVEKTGVIVNLICPGLCITNLVRSTPQDFKDMMHQMYAAVGRTAEDGSRTLLHGAVAGPESHGKLLHSCEDGEPDVPDWVKDDTTMQKRTWEAIANELETAEPGCVARMLDCA
ncbi:NAD(P)-binding protein [Parathielavia appendiculata]|uniref:NAD(P)-binding protein n=1 Tax=Parathielavia appendiculata TaxID=2587402 RepID=A0AAN6YZC1_9PEZI|nr:NAD(P)-binding protein [Parathielavia appendiculata]